VHSAYLAGENVAVKRDRDRERVWEEHRKTFRMLSVQVIGLDNSRCHAGKSLGFRYILYKMGDPVGRSPPD